MRLGERARGTDQSLQDVQVQGSDDPRSGRLHHHVEPARGVVCQRGTEPLLPNARRHRQVGVRGLEQTRWVIVDHDRALGSIAGGSHDRLMIPSRHGTGIDYDPVRPNHRQKADLPSARALDLEAYALGGLGIEAEGLAIRGGADCDRRCRPIRTIQSCQRNYRQARCRGRIAQRPPRGPDRKPATAGAGFHERNRFTS